jgi:hypothetical protein
MPFQFGYFDSSKARAPVKVAVSAADSMSAPIKLRMAISVP